MNASNRNINEGYTKRISRSHGLNKRAHRKKGRHGANNMGHHLVQFAGGRRRALL